MRRSGGQWRWVRCHAAVVAVVLIMSGCGEDGSASPPVEVATTLQATVVSTSLPERTGRPTVLPLSGPAASVGVGLIDGTEVRLLTAKGETIAVGDAAGFSVNDQNRPVDARIEGGSVALLTGTTTRTWAGAPFAQDCTGPRSEQRGRSVAVCGSSARPPDRIDVADSRGVRTLIQRPSNAGRLGHWRAAQLSPDGASVLAQWSGECEVPIAFFVDTATGAARPVTGEERTGGTPNSVGLAWADDGTALVVLPGGACGLGTQPAGLYSVTDGQPPRLLHRSRSEFPVGFAWRVAT